MPYSTKERHAMRTSSGEPCVHIQTCLHESTSLTIISQAMLWNGALACMRALVWQSTVRSCYEIVFSPAWEHMLFNTCTLVQAITPCSTLIECVVVQCCWKWFVSNVENDAVVLNMHVVGTVCVTMYCWRLFWKCVFRPQGLNEPVP